MKFALVFLFLSAQALAAIDNPYLYEVRKAGRVSWMLGTLHMGIDISELIDFIEPRLKVSRKSYTEVLVSNERIELWASDPGRAVVESDQFDWSKGKPLSNETKDLLRSNLRVPENLLNKLTSESCFALSSFEFHRASPRTLDFQLLQLAEKLKVPRAELDTDDLRAKATEADLTGNFSQEWQCDMDSMAKKESRAHELVQFMADQYRQGLTKPGIEMPREGLSLRNRAWADKLVPELEKGSVFVSMGLAHVHGPDGLIELLRRRGFTVTRYPHPED